MGFSIVVKMLIRAWADVDYFNVSACTPLLLGYHDPDTIRELLHAGADINKYSPDNHKSAAMMAAEFGRLGSANVLAQAGADLGLSAPTVVTPFL
jgi:ankyrin repeat protein